MNRKWYAGVVVLVLTLTLGQARRVPGEPQTVHDNIVPVCTSVTGGPDVASGNVARLTVNAITSLEHSMPVTWSTTCGRILGTGAEVYFDAAGIHEGACIVTVQISDCFNPPVECLALVLNIRPRDSTSPSLELKASRSRAAAGTKVHIRADARTLADPGPVTIIWESEEYLSVISETEAILDTSASLGGPMVVVATARSGAGSSTRAVEVYVEPPPPVNGFPITRIQFGRDGAKLDRTSRRGLDALVDWLGANRAYGVVIDGYSGPSERGGMAARRAEAVFEYLLMKEVHPCQLKTRSDSLDCTDVPDPELRVVRLAPVSLWRSDESLPRRCPGASVRSQM